MTRRVSDLRGYVLAFYGVVVRGSHGGLDTRAWLGVWAFFAVSRRLSMVGVLPLCGLAYRYRTAWLAAVFEKDTLSVTT